MLIPGFLFLLLLQTQTATQPPAGAANPQVVVDTSLGSFTIELFQEKAPVSVENFLQYVREGFYAGTIFHRVVAGYVVQGGGYTPDLSEKPTRPPIQNEATNGLSNQRGTVAMARTRTVRSGTSQFFVNVVDNRRLDHTGYAPDEFGYAVFGRVVEGMDVVDRISKVPTTIKDGMESVPIDPVIIKGITVKR
jgi:cyclophilin family peptidyl-prolyl cis-trans isomerase